MIFNYFIFIFFINSKMIYLLKINQIKKILLLFVFITKLLFANLTKYITHKKLRLFSKI